MKTFHAVIVPVFLCGFLIALHADDKPQVVNPKQLTDKVSVTLGEEFTLEFQRDGDRLLQPTKSQRTGEIKGAIKIKLDVTSASPIPPPREGATRPFLAVENNFEHTLHFRALVRSKASSEFIELTQGIEPLPAGDIMHRCWDFDSTIEEVVLYDFKLTDKSVE